MSEISTEERWSQENLSESLLNIILHFCSNHMSTRKIPDNTVVYFFLIGRDCMIGSLENYGLLASWIYP